MDDLYLEQPVENPLINACYDGDIKKVTKLLDYDGSIVNDKNSGGSTALHIAAQNGFLDLVNVLIYRGGDVNLLTLDGWTPLHFAAQRGYVEVVNTLIKAGVKIDVQGLRYKRTALHYAADQGRAGAVMALLAAGANASLLDIAGLTAFDIASKKSHFETAELLKSR